jgi:hypothetical protein
VSTFQFLFSYFPYLLNISQLDSDKLQIYNYIMDFQWDESKNSKNLEKHGIAFEDAVHVFADPLSVARSDYFQGEIRQQIIGHIEGNHVVLAIYSMRNEEGASVIRIISARKATPQERRHYENGTWLS